MKAAIDLKLVRTRLETKRAELLEGVARAREIGAVETDAGAPDIADRATSAFTREFSFSLSENESHLLRLIDEALARLDNGRYGICVHCGGKIEPQRLNAVPWARHCIACQELQDQGEI
ncbi:MAG: TraR/DksA family transcriptional regulator [Thermoanaerobaculaceae bacterium]|nr:TraR/DksA family transcriptional regulator [Thermoanaerobaculaceae bacterium]